VSHSEHPTRRESRARRRQLFVLLVPIAATTIASAVGAALAPKLLVDHPLALLALNPVPRHLVLVSGSVDALPFTAVAAARLFFPDPFYFLVGRLYGSDAVRWVENRSGGAGRFVRFAERAFEKARYAVLFVAPAGLICVLAGASRMRTGPFVAVNLAGTLTGVTLARLFGEALAVPLEAVRDFIQANVLVLTAISVVLVASSVVLRRRQARRAARQSARDLD
jgi:membrane protein DedA with SNARE-associated domain